MRQAFSLIELIISVIILSIAITSLYKVSTNTLQINEQVRSDINVSLLASIGAIKYNESLKKKETNLYELLRGKKIENDELIRILKNVKIKYSDKKELKEKLLLKSISIQPFVVDINGTKVNYVQFK